MHKVRRRNFGRFPPASMDPPDDSPKSKFMKYSEQVVDALFDVNYCTFTFLAVVWTCSVGLGIAVLYNVPYTEIDWKAYMQEVEGFLNGTLDYYQLKGDTGPLVYPAGFVYLFSIFYKLTSGGSAIFVAQSIFLVIYSLLLAVVFFLYHCKVAPYMVLLVTFGAYRITSIFILRMFNDGVAMLFYYLSMAFMTEGRWNTGAILYSVAVSVKMNVLLSSPGLLVYLLMSRSILQTTKFLGLCAFVQILLGSPFLLTHPLHYIERAFDLRRVFMYTWTVNWKFLPEWLFVDRRFHVALLAGHITVLVAIAFFRWSQTRTIIQHKKDKMSKINAKKALIDSMCESNFIGICFARSLHYQFYVWYYHSLPFLMRNRCEDRLLTLMKTLPTMLILEGCWIYYPPNAISSLIMFCCHIWIGILAFRKVFAE